MKIGLSVTLFLGVAFIVGSGFFTLAFASETELVSCPSHYLSEERFVDGTILRYPNSMRLRDEWIDAKGSVSAGGASLRGLEKNTTKSADGNGGNETQVGDSPSVDAGMAVSSEMSSADSTSNLTPVPSGSTVSSAQVSTQRNSESAGLASNRFFDGPMWRYPNDERAIDNHAWRYPSGERLVDGLEVWRYPGGERLKDGNVIRYLNGSRMREPDGTFRDENGEVSDRSAKSIVLLHTKDVEISAKIYRSYEELEVKIIFNPANQFTLVRRSTDSSLQPAKLICAVPSKGGAPKVFSINGGSASVDVIVNDGYDAARLKAAIESVLRAFDKK